MSDDRSGQVGSIEVIAHRGYSAAAPENTVAALHSAIVAGAHALEFDLQMTADGTPVLFHDESLDRTTDASGRIGERTEAQLIGVDAGSWFSPEFAREPIPTLEFALREVRNFHGAIYPEIKPNSSEREAITVAGHVDRGWGVSRVTFISMNWIALSAIRHAHPRVRLGYIVEHVDRTDAAFDLAAGDSQALVDFDARILLADPAIARRAADEEIELAVWTVNEVSDADALFEMGVRRFTTNEVTRLLNWAETK